MKRSHLIPTIDLLVYCAATIFAVATAWWISTEGGVSDLVLYSALQATFLLILTPCLAPFGEKLERTGLFRIAIIVLVVRAALCIGVSLCYGYQIGILVFACLLDSVAMALYMPLSKGVLPDLVIKKDELNLALSLQKRYQQIGSIVGPVIAGGLLTMTSGYLYAYCMVAMITLVAIAVLMAHSELMERIKNLTRPDQGDTWSRSLVASVQTLMAIPVEFGWNIRSFFLAALLMPLCVTLLPLYVHERGYSGFWFSMLQLAFSAGAVLATFTYQYTTKYVPRPYISMLSLSITGLALIAFSFTNHQVAMAALLCIVGCMFTINQLNGQTHRLLAMPRDMRIRFTAINFTNIRLATALGITCAGALLDHLSINTLYIMFGVLSVACAFTTVLIPGYYRFMSLTQDEVDGYYQRHFPGAFRVR